MRCKVTITAAVLPGTDPVVMVLASREGAARHVFRRAGDLMTHTLDLDGSTIEQLRSDGYLVDTEAAEPPPTAPTPALPIRPKRRAKKR